MQLYLIQQAIIEVSIHMHIVDAEDPVWTMYREYCSALRKAGYADLQVTKPLPAITHITKK